MKELLVFVRAGHNSIHRTWKYDPEKVDLVISSYADDIDQTANGKTYFGGYNKFDHLSILINSRRIRIEDYRYFFLVDDDVAITWPLEKIVVHSDEVNLYIGQPALNWASHYTFSCTLWNPLSSSRISYFAEVMCPIFSYSALQNSLDTFTLSKSTWGIDLAYSNRATKMGTPPIILDKLRVTHCKKILLQEGAWYKKLRNDGIDPKRELAEIEIIFGKINEGIIYFKSPTPNLARICENLKLKIRGGFRRLGMFRKIPHLIS